jgi:hypothetical protein
MASLKPQSNDAKGVHTSTQRRHHLQKVPTRRIELVSAGFDGQVGVCFLAKEICDALGVRCARMWEPMENALLPQIALLGDTRAC